MFRVSSAVPRVCGRAPLHHCDGGPGPNVFDASEFECERPVLFIQIRQAGARAHPSIAELPIRRLTPFSVTTGKIGLARTNQCSTFAASGTRVQALIASSCLARHAATAFQNSSAVGQSLRSSAAPSRHRSPLESRDWDQARARSGQPTAPCRPRRSRSLLPATQYVLVAVALDADRRQHDMLSEVHPVDHQGDQRKPT